MIGTTQKLLPRCLTESWMQSRRKIIFIIDEWDAMIRDSDKLLEDTLKQDTDAVAAAIAKVRDSAYAPTFYNEGTYL